MLFKMRQLRQVSSLRNTTFSLFPVKNYAFLLLLGLFFPPSVLKAQIQGKVYRDFNANGVFDSTATFKEVGLTDITVNAYNAAGTSVGTTTTNATGNYTIPSVSGALRVEFTGLTISDYAAPRAASGANANNTSVQFITAPTTSVSFGVNYPADYCHTANPRVAVPCYITGNSQSAGTAANADAIVNFPYDNGTVNKLANMGRVGATWGVAYHRESKKLFSAAFGKRHIAWGPLGSAGIYVTAAAQTANAVTATSNFVNLNAVNSAFDAGTVTRNIPSTNPADPSYDQNMFNEVGKVGMGGIEISENGKYLYVVNLKDRKLWRVEIGVNGTAPTLSSQIEAYAALPNPCTNSTFRPFALKVYRGDIYIGGVCDGVNASTNAISRNNLSLTIYKVSESAIPATATFTSVFTAPLTFDREGALNSVFGWNGAASQDYIDANGTITTLSNTSWHPWARSMSDLLLVQSDRFLYPQPMLSDIEFDVNGAMILGFSDRTGHQVGWNNYGTNTSSSTTYEGVGGGDLLRVHNNNGTFVMESNGTADGVTTGGAGNKDAPGGGEFYFEDSYDPFGADPYGVTTAGSHDETGMGGTALLSGKGTVISTVFDPTKSAPSFGYDSGGARWFKNSDGKVNNAILLYDSDDVGSFAKASGLGDLEAMCDPQPIEIGNRVWRDTDKDGIQDADEAGISGLTVELYRGTTRFGTTTTDANGNYYFNNANVNLGGVSGLKPDSSYQIRIAAAQTPLSNLALTTANVGSNGSDLIDNDATTSGSNAIIDVTLGSAGQNNHALDFGFSQPGCEISVTPSVSNCYDSNGNQAGGTSMTNVQVVVAWVNAPSGATITVSCTGAANKTINPATTTSPAVVVFQVPSNGASVNVQAVFSTSTACTDTKSITVPSSNCLLTPCCPSPTSTSFSNTSDEFLPVQTNCNTVLTKTFTVSGLTNTISDVNLGVLLSHNFRGDVRIQLTSPNGTTVTVANQSSDNLDNYDVLLDDAAAGILNHGADQDTLAPNFAADLTAKPSNPMTVFNGENPNGTWTLTFCNTNFSTSGGRLLHFKEARLEIATSNPTACTNKVGGTVWRDFNSNGVKDANETDGLSGVTVSAYDCTGNLIESVTTDYLGQYVFTNVTPSLSQPVRVEFSTNSTLYKAGLVGTDNNSDVRFITAASCNLNYGVNNPADYCQSNPSLIINCYVQGAYNSGSGTGHTIVGLPYNYTQDPDGNVNGTTAPGAVTFDPPIYTPAPPDPDAIADHNQVGSTWGLAYDRDRKNLFVAAYIKAGTSLGPSNESTGKIYKIADPLGTKTVTDYVDLNAIFGAGTAGTNPHPIASTSFAMLGDAATNGVIGKVGLGDMAISNDGAFLYVVNLADRKLYKIPTTGTLNSSTITRFDIPTTGQPTVTDAIGTAGTCPDADVRPFGLGVHPDGTIYVGGVCSCESLSSGYNAEPNNASYQLTAYVWTFNGTSFTRVLNESLRFDRDNNGGYTTGDNYAASSPRNQDWEPWHDLSDVAIYNSQNPAQNEPMLADISFDENGDMYIGMRDRLGDCVTLNGGFLSSGDIYKVAKTPAGWAMEKNATAGTITTSGANNKQGPAGGEFIYTDIQGDGIKNSGTGGVFNLLGTHQVASTAIDAVYLTSTGQSFFNPSAGGIQIYGTQDGGLKGTYNLYEANDINTFAKAAGVGAIAAVCSPAPKEIGNYVWVDTDKDGIQDPCEQPISGVTVNLYRRNSNTVIATTTTDANGNYKFTDYEEFGTGFDTLRTDTLYFIAINDAAQYDIAAHILTIGGQHYKLTSRNIGEGASPDINDSDSYLFPNASRPFSYFPVDSVTVRGAGYVNHTLDFGFRPALCSLTVTPSVSDCYDSNGSTAGGTSMRRIRVLVSWQDNPGTELINVTCTGAAAQTIDPNVVPITNPQVVYFDVPSNGATVTIAAEFATTTTCQVSQNLTIPNTNCVETPCEVGNVGGTVWKDFTSDGVKSAADTFGLAGVTVTAYDCNGTAVGTTTTDAKGQYTFTGLTPSVSTPIRLEFSNINLLYAASFAGSGNGTNVQFVKSAGCNYNLGVNNPTDYCETNPQITVPCYLTGNLDGGVLVTLPYNYMDDLDGNINRSTTAFPSRDAADNLGGTYEALNSQIGTVYGAAWDKHTKRLFTSAYMKRKMPFGVLGNESTGAIYVNTDPANTNTPSLFADLNAIFPNSTGTNPHPIATTDWLADSTVLYQVGRIGLGDLDISRDGKKLYTVNLNTKELWTIPTDVTPNATNITRVAIPTTNIPIASNPANTCPSTNVRPFGLGVDKDGNVYVGGVCTGETNAKDSDLGFYIWKYDGTSFTLELTQSFAYRNGYKPFRYWKEPTDAQLNSLIAPGITGYNNWTSHPMPMVGDIEFDVDGSMVIGIKDRYGDLIPQSYVTTGFPFTRTGGDILRASKTPTGFAVEYGAISGLNETTGTSTYGDLANGIGGKEYYFNDTPGDSDRESGQGALLLIPGKDEVVTTAYDAVFLIGNDTRPGNNFNTGGLLKLSNKTGLATGAYDVFLNADANVFGKAQGLGDIEALCSAAPIQIGNYVFNDLDKDGVQDPCDTPLSNVTVELWKGGVKIAETTTDANGNYYFSRKHELSDPNTWTGTGADTTLLPNMTYEVRILTGQTSLNGKELTNRDATTNTGNDLNDSDASISGGYASISFTTGAAGSVNHTLDFGFSCVPPTITTVAFDTAKCVNGVIGSDAWVAVRGIAGMTKYTFRTNATDSLWNNTATASTADSIRISNIPNPATATTYTFRIWGTDTTCFNDTTIILPPSVCPPCSITGTFMQNSCNNNGTTSTGADDHFTVTVSAVSATNGGTSGKYEVVLMPAGTVLNAGGTNYGTPITVGGAGIFNANGTATYMLKVRDLNIAGCESTVFTTMATAACSTLLCPPQICLPVTVTRN
jgi:SdrD B-like domain/Proprotein convertase P-domain